MIPTLRGVNPTLLGAINPERVLLTCVFVESARAVDFRLFFQEFGPEMEFFDFF